MLFWDGTRGVGIRSLTVTAPPEIVTGGAVGLEGGIGGKGKKVYGQVGNCPTGYKLLKWKPPSTLMIWPVA
jgi:hypothetical protein